MQIIVHQFEGTSTLDVLPLAAGLVVASAKLDPALSSVDFAIRVARLDPGEVVSSYDAPDVLAFSLYTWNANYSLEVARRARERFPEALIVFGGPSVPRRPERLSAFFAERPFADALVLGEGELTFRELLGAWRGGEPLHEVPGVVTRDEGSDAGYRAGPPRDRLVDFEGTASPYLDGTFEQLYEAHPDRFTAAVLETNRGCPFSCTYCDWGQAIRSRVHELPIARVESEVEWIGGRGIDYLYIVDANFGIRPRDVAIVEHIAGVKQRIGSPAWCYFHLTKNAREKNLRTVETLLEAGIGCQVALSSQDFDEAVLAAIRRQNIRLDRSLELRRVCNQRGIPTFNELLLGLPEQTYHSFCRNLVRAITPYPGDSFFIYLTRLLENAELATPEHRQRFGLQTRRCRIGDASRTKVEDWVAETEEIVVATAAMPPVDWRRAFRFGQLLSAFYNLRLLWVAVQFLSRTLGLHLKGWIEALLEAAEQAVDGSALAELDRLLDRYVEAARAGDALVLPGEATGPGREWAPSDAVALLALRRRDAFIGEVAAVTRVWVAEQAIADPLASPAVVDELFEFESMRLPGLDRRAPFERDFQHDWLTFADRAHLERPVPPKRTVRYRYEPPVMVTLGQNWAQFLVGHLAAMRAKDAPGCVVEVALPPPRALDERAAPFARPVES